MPESLADREIVSTRVVGAPRDRVFRAFADPEELARWWGPKGFTNTFHEFDMRPGGTWRFVMRGPDGKDYKNKSVFREIVKPERIVFEHVSGPHYEMTVTLADQGGRTGIRWRMLFSTAELCERIKMFAMDANEENFDRLEASLAGSD